MNALQKARLLAHIVRWRFTWSQKDLDYRAPGVDPHRFIAAREAARRFADGSTVLSCGLAGNARCSVFYWALRERFQQEGAPRGLTWVNVGAQGSRGRVPGTVEELALPGLVTRYITGHHETVKAMLRLADAGQVELHTLPQGQMTLLLAAQARGESSLRSRVGLNTFLDPRTGPGSAVTPGTPSLYIRDDGDALLYALPPIQTTIFNAPYADAEGNIYFTHAATITENVQGAQAARANGGQVLATVSAIVPKDEARIGLRADQVDAIVVHPYNEQTGSVQQRRYWPMFTVNGQADARDAVAQLKFLNNFLKITPRRGPVENALARLAAARFAQAVPKGSVVNIGVGFPEEVVRLVFEHGLDRDLIFTTETGVYGGLPAPGIFFGAAINPQRMEPSSWMFELYRERLGAAVLGFLQVDSEGNVNVSKRGPRMLDYVGPGGFPDIADSARVLIFVGTWMANATFDIGAGRFAIPQPGTPKFVEKVDEITLSGREAHRLGKQVYYVTNVGCFRLTEQGLLLIETVPGVDIERDILAASRARIHLPAEPVPVAPPAILTGEGFRLQWPTGTAAALSAATAAPAFQQSG